MKLLSCLFAVSLTCSSAAQASFSSAERRVAPTVEHEPERSIELLKGLVNWNRGFAEPIDIERQTKRAALMMSLFNGEQR